MKLSDFLEDILGQKSKIKILRCMFKLMIPMTGRQIAKLSNLNHRTCQLAIRDLELQGVVVVRNVGKSKLYQLNDKNYFVVNGLKNLFEEEQQLLEKVIGQLIDKVNINVVSLILYGSVASGREKPDSDIDILAVTPDKKHQTLIKEIFDQIEADFVDTFGKVLSPYLLSVKEVKERFNKNDRLIQEVVNTGRVVYGKTIMEVLALGSS
ncbi:MAG: nucleotidyltransferase domain-containing protein [Candidatus Diapherotrites archaeon]